MRVEKIKGLGSKILHDGVDHGARTSQAAVRQFTNSPPKRKIYKKVSLRIVYLVRSVVQRLQKSH